MFGQLWGLIRVFAGSKKSLLLVKSGRKCNGFYLLNIIHSVRPEKAVIFWFTLLNEWNFAALWCDLRRRCCSSVTGSAWCHGSWKSTGPPCGIPWCGAPAVSPRTAQPGCLPALHTGLLAFWSHPAQVCSHLVRPECTICKFLFDQSTKE